MRVFVYSCLLCLYLSILNANSSPFEQASISLEQSHQSHQTQENLKSPIESNKPTGSIKPTIVWLVEDKKENIDLLDKTAPTTSVASYIESQIIHQLSQYTIEIKRASIKRIDYFLENNDNMCVANRAKLSTREKYSLFSTPQAFYLAHKLYRFGQDDTLPAELFNENGDIISLKSVFDSFPQAKIAIAEGVSFGPFLDIEIAKLAKENIYYRGGNNRVSALESMLYAK